MKILSMHIPRRAGLALLCCSASVALAAAPARGLLTPEQSLDQDLSGPAVAWLGEIVNVLPAGDETCFVLNRVQAMDYQYAQTATRFVACDSGGFAGGDFAPGKVLKVEGNLGPVMARLIAGQEITAPLVAAPRLTPLGDAANRPFPGYYGGYPSADPFYDPWYPGSFGLGFGFGFGSHHHHGQR